MGGILSYNKSEVKYEVNSENNSENKSKIIIKYNHNHKYSWIKQLLDTRDKYNYFYFDITTDIVDLRNKCPPIYNQGNIGSCTANAICGAYEYDYINNKLDKTERENKENKENNTFSPSRLFLYYNERSLENTVKTDSGATLRDGMKSINKIGVCSENEWPYNTSKFTIKPDDSCYKSALSHEALSYFSIKQTLDQLKSSLIMGYPFVFGFNVYESFESEEVAKTGIMPMPGKDEKLLGGHAVMAVGYNNNKKIFIIRNSWGNEWGMDGYFYMPYDYITDSKLCSDFWLMKTVK